VEKCLDHVNLHLVDQSRRIDETNGRIDSMDTDVITLSGAGAAPAISRASVASR